MFATRTPWLRPDRVLLVLMVMASAVQPGCGSGGPGGQGGSVGASCDTSRPCRTTLQCSSAGVCVVPSSVDAGVPRDGGFTREDLGPGVTLTGLELSPADTTLDVEVGTPRNIQFTSVLRRSNNSTGVANARYEASAWELGTLDPVTGLFVANGLLGGTVTVTATQTVGASVFTDSATLTVNLTRTIGGGGPTDPAALFSGSSVTNAARAATLQYPLNGAVVPQNIMPMDVQWSCGPTGTATCPEADTFRVTLEKPHARVVVYTRNPAEAVNDHYLVEDAAWRALAQSDPSAAMSVRVDRYDSSAGEVVSGAPIEVNFAVAAVTGTIYYWDIDDEKIRRINDGAAVSDILLPYPDGPGHNGERGDNCVGCHAISTSGRYMLASINYGNYGALFDLTRGDLGNNPAPKEWAFAGSATWSWRFASFSPDDTRAVVAAAFYPTHDYLVQINPFTGVEVVPSTGYLPDPATHPAWARDGRDLAYIGNTDNWGGRLTRGDLNMLAVTGVDSFVNRNNLPPPIHVGSSLSGAPEGGSTDSYPSWSPDSAWVAFAHGTGSRSDPRDENGNVGTAYKSALYLIRRDGTGLTRLDAIASSNLHEFQPNFSPFISGGYYWLSYLSRRPYGNRSAGNAGGDADGIQPGQIWVTAVRVNADGTFDPSGVPYWLPGQIPTHRNISAIWAPRACRTDGDGCSVNSECCGGACGGTGGAGALTCVPTPSTECRQLGETCSESADCCEASVGATCTNNSCVNVIFG